MPRANRSGGKSSGEEGERQEDLGPSVRLSLASGQAEREGNDSLCGPTVRLSASQRKKGGENDQGGNTEGENLVRNLTLRLVAPNAERGEGAVDCQGSATLQVDMSDRPALLVSYVYLETFLLNKHRYLFRDWVMDSGAFSAANCGMEIKLQDYIERCKTLLATDPKLVEVYALDVIGDWKATLKNTEEMWRQGVPAIPCFHYGEPWPTLKGLCKDYPKVAIGGCVGKRDKDKFAQQCFARVWPKPLHGFGFGSEKSLMLVPWHSVDATNWEIGPCKYGWWKGFGASGQRAKIPVRGSKQNLRAEVEYYLALEKRARDRWRREMEQLKSMLGPGKLDGPPACRLVVQCQSMRVRNLEQK